MTRSEEESSFLSLLSQLSPAADSTPVLIALTSIKHQLIGHDQNKELFVQLGVAEPLVRILGTDGEVDDAWVQARVEAGIALGSLAYGGESYILHLLSCNALTPLTASLNPSTSPPKLILSSLRTLNTMLDTYVSPSSSTNPSVTIASTVYTPEVLSYLCKILSQTAGNALVQQQISLTASLIAKSCGQYQPANGAERTDSSPLRAGLHQRLLAEAGVLDALATRLGSFALPDRSSPSFPKVYNENLLPPPAASTAKLAPILDALATVIKGSKLRAIEFLFSQTLCTIFPPSDPNQKPTGVTDTGSTGTTSTFLPHPKPASDALIQPPQEIITPAAFPPLSAAVSSASSTHFPPLSATSGSHPMSFPALHHYHPHHHHHHSSGLTEAQSILLSGGVGGGDDSESSIGGDTPLRRRAETADLDEEERARPISAQVSEPENSEPEIEVEESNLVPWLIAQVRFGDPITRLMAANLLTNLFLIGLVGKKIVPMLALLVVPVVVRLLDDHEMEGRRYVGLGSTGVGGVDAQTWNQWMVEEKAPAVLARLIMESPELQKAAVDAGAVGKLAGMLKRSADSGSSMAVNGVNGDSAAATDEPPNRCNPEYNHRMRVKEGTLRCLANLGLFKDEYRKAIIEAGVVQTVVTSCLKPLDSHNSAAPSDSSSEGNPPPVLIAACGLVRSVSRSVSILRTSLIDAGVSTPLFTLLRHEDVEVRIAATASVCNLVLDFSPMRETIIEAGAVDVLCEHAKSDNPALRLNGLWAIKHLVLEADPPVKRRSFEGLGAEYIMETITNESSQEEEDEEMAESPDNTEATGAMEDSIGNLRSIPDDSEVPAHLPPKAAAAVALLRKKERTASTTLAERERTALQEQGLEYLRNFLCGGDVIIEMIDLIFEQIGADRLLSLLERLLSSSNPPGEIVNAVVYILVHIAAGAPRHRQKIIERTELMNALLSLWNHGISGVRSGLAWVVINLTWAEDGDEAEGVRQRVGLLKETGWGEKLREMKKDPQLDVRERVKTAEYQLGIGRSDRS